MRSPTLLISAALVLLGSAFPVAADDTGPLTTQYSLRSWSGGDGITLGSIRSLAQTPDGFLWLASTAGLVRFDGFRFASTDLFDGDVDSAIRKSFRISSTPVSVPCRVAVQRSSASACEI